MHKVDINKDNSWEIITKHRIANLITDMDIGRILHFTHFCLELRIEGQRQPLACLFIYFTRNRAEKSAEWIFFKLEDEDLFTKVLSVIYMLLQQNSKGA